MPVEEKDGFKGPAQGPNGSQELVKRNPSQNYAEGLGQEPQQSTGYSKGKAPNPPRVVVEDGIKGAAMGTSSDPNKTKPSKRTITK